MPVNRINVEHCIPLEPAHPLIIAHIAGPEVDGLGRDRRGGRCMTTGVP